MKKWYVYELYNELGSIEYVGETIDPTERFYSHTKRQSVLKKDGRPNGNGKFYKRLDILLNIVKEFDTKSDAWNFQCELQKEYGFNTDGETNAEARKGNQHAKGNTFVMPESAKLKIGEAKREYWRLKKQCRNEQ